LKNLLLVYNASQVSNWVRTLKDIENDPRVAFVQVGAENTGIWIFFNENYFYEPNMTKTDYGRFGGPGSSFVHVKTLKDAIAAMQKVIHES
jgi:hypothetical protein